MSRRRMIGSLLTPWLLAGLVFVAVAHPERCPSVDAEGARAAVGRAVDWLVVNQEPDGAFLYRYDRGAAVDLGGYNEVRHAGVLLSLYQASAVAPQAGDAADLGLRWALQRTSPFRDGRAFGSADRVDTGSSALLLAALAERRAQGGDGAHDDTMRALGRFLVETTGPDGSVAAAADRSDDRVFRDLRSAFFTGETAWALARLHATFPDEGWDAAARRISRYLATARDDAERRFPPVSDHWGAYSLDEIAAWPARLSADEVAEAKRQAGLFGLQTRFESQRRAEGWQQLTRGEFALGAGVGTLGEGLGAIGRLAAVEPRLADVADDAAERLVCVAGMLADRQADDTGRPEVDGAWFRAGVTQMDDQQHAISALLAALPALDAEASDTAAPTDDDRDP